MNDFIQTLAEELDKRKFTPLCFTESIIAFEPNYKHIVSQDEFLKFAHKYLGNINDNFIQNITINEGQQYLKLWLTSTQAHETPLIDKTVGSNLTHLFFKEFNSPLVFTNHTDERSWGPVTKHTFSGLIGCIDHYRIGLFVIVDED